MRKTVPDPLALWRDRWTMFCTFSLLYYVSFFVVALISLVWPFKLPYPLFGYAFWASSYVVPFALTTLPGVRERAWAWWMATTISIALAIHTAQHWMALPVQVLNLWFVLWIVSMIGILALVISQLVNATSSRVHRWVDRGAVGGRVHSLLAWLPRSIRDDAEGMIREFAERRDRDRAAGRSTWITLAVCGWDFVGYVLRSAIYLIFARLLGKLIGSLLGLR